MPRKAGWDTHGLPVEVEVEKELRIHGKAAIEAYGVEPFVKKCLESVFRYTREWEELTERVAFWVDLGDAYVTYHRSYVESVWWALSQLFEKGLLYQGHKVVWWWAQGGTALSSGEVGQGYKTVDDPSVYVAFPVVGEDNLSLLVWTTTPWTLPSNVYAAVNADFDYVVARAKDGRRYSSRRPRRTLDKNRRARRRAGDEGPGFRREEKMEKETKEIINNPEEETKFLKNVANSLSTFESSFKMFSSTGNNSKSVLYPIQKLNIPIEEARCITEESKKLLEEATQYMIDKYGAKVVYLDTDTTLHL